jgi:hypothetical protein
MRFDWYQATIQGRPREVLALIAKLGQSVERNDLAARTVRGSQGWDVIAQGRPVAHVVAGGQFGDTRVHAWATSDDAAPFADLVRQEWPQEHLPTRLDPCQDFVDGKAFKRLSRVGRKIAIKHRTKFPRMADALNPTAGQTQYIGSPRSEFRARIYEKGWEVVNKAMASMGRQAFKPEDITSIRVPGIDLQCHPSEWVRAELQARPKGEAARRAAAIATPEEVWTMTDWSRDFAKEALALDLERAYIRQRKISTDEKALRFMCSQYGNVLARLQLELGDWSCVGLTIGEILSQLAQERSS